MPGFRNIQHPGKIVGGAVIAARGWIGPVVARAEQLEVGLGGGRVVDQVDLAAPVGPIDEWVIRRVPELSGAQGLQEVDIGDQGNRLGPGASSHGIEETAGPTQAGGRQFVDQRAEDEHRFTLAAFHGQGLRGGGSHLQSRRGGVDPGGGDAGQMDTEANLGSTAAGHDLIHQLEVGDLIFGVERLDGAITDHQVIRVEIPLGRPVVLEGQIAIITAIGIKPLRDPVGIQREGILAIDHLVIVLVAQGLGRNRDSDRIPAEGGMADLGGLAAGVIGGNHAAIAA